MGEVRHTSVPASTLVVYLAVVSVLSAAFIAGALALGKQGTYLAGLYMFGPAIATVVARAFAGSFRDTGLRPGRLVMYPRFWLLGLGIVALNVAAIQLAGALRWDLSGDAALAQIAQRAEESGQPMPSPPAGMTSRDMLLLYSLGGITVLNILPGLAIGFGEEFGWRGLMFPALYRLRPWLAFLAGGLIWYAWHLPLLLVVPAAPPSGDAVAGAVRIVALAVGAIATHTVFAYAYARTGSIWVASLLHGTIDNASRASSYWIVVVDQYAADIALSVSMVLVVGVLIATGGLSVIRRMYRSPLVPKVAPSASAGT